MSWMNWPEDNETVWEMGCTLSFFIGGVEEALGGAWGPCLGVEDKVKCNIWFSEWWDDSLVPEPTAFKVKEGVRESEFFDGALEIVLEAAEGEELTLSFDDIKRAIDEANECDPEAKLLFMFPLADGGLIPALTADGIVYEKSTGRWEIILETYDMYMEA